jgi:hypothetical protein
MAGASPVIAILFLALVALALIVVVVYALAIWLGLGRCIRCGRPCSLLQIGCRRCLS